MLRKRYEYGICNYINATLIETHLPNNTKVPHNKKHILKRKMQKHICKAWYLTSTL